ncbi:hypothetical protein [Nocardia nova]|uniref:hypothetical protein n=1 Tax=Nocardia nova TaxID=37330 RepID=UPI0033DA1CD4
MAEQTVRSSTKFREFPMIRRRLHGLFEPMTGWCFCRTDRDHVRQGALSSPYLLAEITG